MAAANESVAGGAGLEHGLGPAPGIRGLTRRELLRSAMAAGTLMVTGAGFVAASDAAWAMETTVLTPRQMATLIQLARDIYPHDFVGNAFYARAVKGYDTDAGQELVSSGIAQLDALAVHAGHPSYLETGWEQDRVDLLRAVETTEFFQAVRGGLVTGLYNQHELWPLFGYEGESFSKGGYLNRGFDDIDWI